MEAKTAPDDRPMQQIARINQEAPDFRLPGAYHGEVHQYSLTQYRGAWLVLFFYPADFSFICPTEIRGFSESYSDFRDTGAEILGVSTDPVESHIAWSRELGGVEYPLLSDKSKEVCRLYNALNEEEGVALRATFIVDPAGLVQYSAVTNNNVGRSVEETFRVLSALCTGRMCPADWKPGDTAFDTDMSY